MVCCLIKHRDKFSSVCNNCTIVSSVCVHVSACQYRLNPERNGVTRLELEVRLDLVVVWLLVFNLFTFTHGIIQNKTQSIDKLTSEISKALTTRIYATCPQK